MNMAVGIGRAVMKNKPLPTFGCLADRIIETGFIPFLDLLRFALGQAGLHREVGCRQIQGFFIIHSVLQRQIIDF